MCSTESRKPSQRFLPSLLAPTATPAPPLLLSRCTCPCSCPGSGDGGGCGASLRSRRYLLDAWASSTLSHRRLLLQLLLLPCCSVPPCASRSWPRQTGRRPPRLRRQRGPRSATQGVPRRTTRNSSKRKKNAFARRHSPKRRKKGRSNARPITGSHEALCFLSFSALSAGETAAYSSSPPRLGRSAREINGKSKKRERLERAFFFFFFRCCPPLCSTLSVSPLTPSLPSSSLRETDVRLRQRR